MSLFFHTFRWSIFVFFILIFIFFFSKIRKKNNSKDKLVMLRIQMYIRKTNLFGRYWKYSLGSNISLSYLLSHYLFTSLFMSPFLDVFRSLSLSSTFFSCSPSYSGDLLIREDGSHCTIIEIISLLIPSSIIFSFLINKRS